MKKIFITGASGMLGATLVSLWKDKYDIFATGGNYLLQNQDAKRYLIFNFNSKNLSTLGKFCNPEIIIHCAAITSHEYCHKHPDETMRVNGLSVKYLKEIFPLSKLIYISTDAVFPPDTHLASESVPTHPLSIYGKSKELGEKYLLKSSAKNCVIRTTIVGKNMNSKKEGFCERIVNSLRTGKIITLFSDSLFTPISIWHLAKELEWVMNNDTPQLLHIAGKDIISKFDFGLRLSQALKLDTSLIRKGSIDDAALLVKRTKDQTLDSSFYRSLYNRNLPSIDETISILVNKFS